MFLKLIKVMKEILNEWRKFRSSLQEEYVDVSTGANPTDSEQMMLSDPSWYKKLTRPSEAEGPSPAFRIKLSNGTLSKIGRAHV